MGADFGGTDGAFEDAGDLGEGEFLETREQEHLASIAVEAVERGTEEGVVVAGGGAFAGVGSLVGVVLEIGGIVGGGCGGGFAEVIGGAAAGELIHPGGEAAFVAVGVAVFQHALEDDLRDILGGGAVTGEFHEETEERALVALEEFAERVEFAGADGEHQRVVGARFGGGVHGDGINHGRARVKTDFCGGGDHGGREAWRSCRKKPGSG